MISNKETLVEWARRVSSAQSEIGESGAIEVNRGIQKAIESYEADFFSLAILAEAKRGKSTLINALLGRSDDKIAPTDKLPASGAISRFRWADSYHTAVAYRDKQPQAIGFDEIRNYLTEEPTPNNIKSVRSVEIVGPFAKLDKDLVTVGHPGSGLDPRVSQLTSLCLHPASGRIPNLNFSRRQPNPASQFAAIKQ